MKDEKNRVMEDVEILYAYKRAVENTKVCNLNRDSFYTCQQFYGVLCFKYFLYFYIFYVRSALHR